MLYTILHARYSRIKISKKSLSLIIVAVLVIMGIVVATHADLFMHLGAILERQSNLTRTWYMFLHEPFGYGLGAAGPASQIQGGNGFFDFSASGSGFLPENWYLQILIEQGIIGFGIFIILM